MNELLDDIPYGVILCNEVGGMLYVNRIASKLFHCQSGSTDAERNVLSYIDESFINKITDLFLNIKNKDAIAVNFTYLKLKNDLSKFYKLVAKQSDNSTNIILMLYDCTSTKIQEDELIKSYNQMNDNLIRNALVLKSISHICNNVLYKDRSNLSEIVVNLATAFHLQKAAICFRNGTGHVIYATRRSDKTYQVGKLDGNQVKLDCPIWNNEINYIASTELIFKVPRSITCCDPVEQQDSKVNVLKLKLNSQKVIGFFEFVEDDKFKLSNTELEILESLSQLLAYIVNNKEQVCETTNYIKEKFRTLTQTI